MKKNNTLLDSFFKVQVLTAKQLKTDYQCEVLALGNDTGKLNPEYKEFQPILDVLIDSEELSLKSSTSVLARFQGMRYATHLLVTTLGKDKTGVNQLGACERMRRLGANVFLKLKSEKITSACVFLDSFNAPAAQLKLDGAKLAYAFVEGLGLASYEFKKYIGKTTKAKEPKPFDLVLVARNQSEATAWQKGVQQAIAMVSGTFVTRNLGNEPSNHLTPEHFATYAKQLAREFSLKCTILDETQLKKEKMGLFLGVGQGSQNPPRLIKLEYTPKQKSKKTIAFVGKGITFDSGGISIKPSARMEDMKHDMCGAAAVVGAIVAASCLKVAQKIVVVVAAAENMPSGSAIQPGNVLHARNGKTVEISNTDAEGRLVLADALDYTQDFNPDYIIDLATLTGAATVTMGKAASCLMSNHSGFTSLVKKAAELSGERVWELPMYDEYFDDLKSEYADMRNSGDSPSHGTAKGAMFMLQFIREKTKWVHLDIAALAYAVGNVPYYPKKSSTGYGVRLLVELAQQI